METDKIYMIKLMKYFNCWNKDKTDNDRHNNRFLNNLKYICDVELCDKYIFVYYNENKKKIIVVFDGIDNVFFGFYKLDSLNLIKLNELFQEYIFRVKKVVNFINNKYSEYNKLYLGYCLGGYMINNYVSGKNVTGYTYNAYFFRHNNDDIKIINYCEQMDVTNMLSSIIDKKIDRITINSHDKNISKCIDNLLHFNFKPLEKIYDTLHSIYTVDENIISIEF